MKAEYGIIAFHDVLPNSLKWPFDYGFIPQTLADDGDPLDILVINKAGLFSGCLIEVRVLGAIRETKDGVENDRLIAVPLPSPGAPQKSDDYREIEDLPQETFEEIKAFLIGIPQRALVPIACRCTHRRRCVAAFVQQLACAQRSRLPHARGVPLDLRNYANPTDMIGRITGPGPASIAMRTKMPKVMMPSTSPPSLLINLPAIRPD